MYPGRRSGSARPMVETFIPVLFLYQIHFRTAYCLGPPGRQKSDRQTEKFEIKFDWKKSEPIVLQAQMSERGTCWSITINNPTNADLNVTFPDTRWRMKGQIERGAEGTEHYQGMLETPQVRFSAVKKVLPRAHIELAKNKKALEKYVSKTDTRIATVEDINGSIPTLFDYQHTIASKWNDNEFDEHSRQFNDEFIGKNGMGEVALLYVDKLVAIDIENGLCGIEYIAINPMWRSAWKKFWRSLIARERKLKNNIEGIDIENGPTTESSENQSVGSNQEVFCEEDLSPSQTYSEC